MNSQEAEIEHSSQHSGKKKVLGVIVLTDNRQNRPTDLETPQKYRSSAFKDTEYDPLEYSSGVAAYSQDENMIVELSRRLTYLEARVKELSKNQAIDNEQADSGHGHLKKKNRRKFTDLTRDQMCKLCKKMYGSQTSLKYHIKLKHAKEEPNHSQVQ